MVSSFRLFVRGLIPQLVNPFVLLRSSLHAGAGVNMQPIRKGVLLHLVHMVLASKALPAQERLTPKFFLTALQIIFKNFHESDHASSPGWQWGYRTSIVCINRLLMCFTCAWNLIIFVKVDRRILPREPSDNPGSDGKCPSIMSHTTPTNQREICVCFYIK